MKKPTKERLPTEEEEPLLHPWHEEILIQYMYFISSKTLGAYASQYESVQDRIRIMWQIFFFGEDNVADLEGDNPRNNGWWVGLVTPVMNMT